MAKDVISVDGKDVEVREDTAKAYRGVNWAIWSVVGFAIITAIVFFLFFGTAARDGNIKSPAQAGNSTVP